MSGEAGCVKYGQHLIEFDILRRDRSTLQISVDPDATVEVVAPIEASLDAICEKVRKRAAWVRRQQRYFIQFLPRTPERRYVSGETHLYLGRQYRLKVVPHIQASVRMTRGYILVQSHSPDNPEFTRKLVEGWYKERAYVKLSERLEINLLRFPSPEEYRPKAVIVRQLSQRWGSMSPGSRLLLNRRLIEAPTDAVDYVITHELCHISEPNHGPRFFSLLDRVMPDWPKRKDRLEKIMA
ncbi:M48 family metallopeptidase [Roseibium aggregatum]|uniref:M48 family metallopeptidase n=1 Tax=Roseibium aggregatum TaxID=187304 RepID=A0A926S889_9HYPH|nr:SprT family zinc-dependent metalloprotease [Roseibium aggregatum]MBD1549591.1 M48 family metallopeptidase [Roseibium aggregatum]